MFTGSIKNPVEKSLPQVIHPNNNTKKRKGDLVARQCNKKDPPSWDRTSNLEMIRSMLTNYSLMLFQLS